MSEAARTVGKRINHAALGALKEALTAIYWFKSDLESFIRNCVKHPEIITRVSFSDNKRVVASRLVDLLAANQDRYLPTLLELMEEVSSFDDFSHLSRLEDGPTKVARAKQAVAALNKQHEVHAGLVAEKAGIEKRREEARVEALRRDALKDKLETLRLSYSELLGLDAQKRGYRLQDALSELFSLFDLDPKGIVCARGRAD